MIICRVWGFDYFRTQSPISETSDISENPEFQTLSPQLYRMAPGGEVGGSVVDVFDGVGS